MQSYDSDTAHFLKSLGFPELRVHHSFNHFDFTRPSRRILVIGPMGSGKTEYSSRVWRDSKVAGKKSAAAGKQTTSGSADRRNVFFVRSKLDGGRFPGYPEDALAYRGGYDRCGNQISQITDSFELEKLFEENPHIGTWIIDEASFYEERLIYVVTRASEERGLIFIFPTLILNFRKDIFNPTARFLLEAATDVFPLTAYCEHEDCLTDSFYTYRYYLIDNKECPALYFDPLIIIGGDTEKHDPKQPNYCTRCDVHHYLPGKEYTFLILKPLGVAASQGDLEPLKQELGHIKNDMQKSRLFSHFQHSYGENGRGEAINLNALKVSCIAEKALMYLFAEQNLITLDQMEHIIEELDLDRVYMQQSLADNKRPADLL